MVNDSHCILYKEAPKAPPDEQPIDRAEPLFAELLLLPSLIETLSVSPKRPDGAFILTEWFDLNRSTIDDCRLAAVLVVVNHRPTAPQSKRTSC